MEKMNQRSHWFKKEIYGSLHINIKTITNLETILVLKNLHTIEKVLKIRKHNVLTKNNKIMYL